MCYWWEYVIFYLSHYKSVFHVIKIKVALQTCQTNIVKTPTQLQRNLNVVWGWTWKWLCKPTHPTTQTQCRQYLTCLWPDFDQTLKVSSWDRIEQISTVMVTFVQATFVLATFVHISNISAIADPILTKSFRPNVFSAQDFFGQKNFLDKNLVWPNIILT